jgi:TonB family protein
MKNNLGARLGSILLLLLAAVALLVSFRAGGQEFRSRLPTVVAIGVPTYPQAVRVAHIEGIVHIKITTDGQRVTDAQVQDGPELLAVSAEKNVRTWQFSPHDPTTFTVTYRYKLVPRLKGGSDNTSVTLSLPSDVEVSAMPPMNVDFSPDH